MQLSDDEFVKQFENKTLPESEFSHHGHMRLAWLYMQQFEHATAVSKIATGIREYATSLGAAQKFNHTLTVAIMRIMYQRMKSKHFESFDQYLSENSDLVENMSGLLGHYYSSELLHSEQARQSWVAPDINALP